MAIIRPKWCPAGTIMTERGWENPRTGELLASRKFTASQVTEWKKAHGLQRKSPVKKAEAKAEEIQAPKPKRKATKKKAVKKEVLQTTADAIEIKTTDSPE